MIPLRLTSKVFVLLFYQMSHVVDCSLHYFWTNSPLKSASSSVVRQPLHFCQWYFHFESSLTSHLDTNWCFPIQRQFQQRLTCVFVNRTIHLGLVWLSFIPLPERTSYTQLEGAMCACKRIIWVRIVILALTAEPVKEDIISQFVIARNPTKKRIDMVPHLLTVYWPQLPQALCMLVLKPPPIPLQTERM